MKLSIEEKMKQTKITEMLAINKQSDENMYLTQLNNNHLIMLKLGIFSKKNAKTKLSRNVSL